MRNHQFKIDKSKYGRYEEEPWLLERGDETTNAEVYYLASDI